MVDPFKRNDISSVSATPARNGQHEAKPEPRLVVIHLSEPLLNDLGWPIALPAGSAVALPLLALRPDHADQSLPACISRAMIFEPKLQLGTIDELVAAYRSHLEACMATAQSTTENRHAVEQTQRAFEGVRSGDLVPLFASGVEGRKPKIGE